MRGWLFGLFLATVFVAVAITAVGLLANWGIWIESPLVKAGEELPLLGSLVTGVILAIVALALEIGRRWFLSRTARDELASAYLDLLGAIVVLPTTSREQANINYTMLLDYLAEHMPIDKNEDLRVLLKERLGEAVNAKMGIRYGGAQGAQPVREVLAGG